MKSALRFLLTAAVVIALGLAAIYVLLIIVAGLAVDPNLVPT